MFYLFEMCPHRMWTDATLLAIKPALTGRVFCLINVHLLIHFYMKLTLTNYKMFYFSQMSLDLVPRVDGEAVDVDQMSVVELYK